MKYNTNEHKEWLNLTVENAIDPDLPICDPHHHLWDRPNDRYLLNEFLQDAGGGHNIVQTVFVQVSAMYRKYGPQEMKPVGETEFIAGIAAQSASEEYGNTIIAGIVGFADLTLGSAVAPVLEAHIAASGNRFRGVRHGAAWDASVGSKTWIGPRTPAVKGLMSDAKYREGLACLQKHGLSYDAWVHHPQLMELVDLAKGLPDLIIIVNHTGGPLGIGPYAGKRTEVFQDWKRGISALAKYPNVYMKLGGLGVPSRGFGWDGAPKPPGSIELSEQMAPYYRTCIELFGANRCMFESNFPPDKISYSYTVMWNAFKRITKDYSPAERAALFYDTAVKAYRLPTEYK